MGGATLTEAELARAWNPPCSGRSAQVALNGGGVVTVHPVIVDAVRALNDVLVRHSYQTRAADTGAYVCLSGDTEVITRDGWVPIGELVGTEPELLVPRGPVGTHQFGGPGVWRRAPVRSGGQQPLMKLTLTRWGVERIVYATAEHRWYVRRKHDKTCREVTTRELQSQIDVGVDAAHRVLTVRPQSVASRSIPSPVGIMAGLVYGDGTIMPGAVGAAIALHGDKNIQLLRYFPDDIPRSGPYTRDGYAEPAVHVRGLPRSWKLRAPALDEGQSVLYGWLAGYFAADGRITAKGQVEIHSVDRWRLEEARRVALTLGIASASITSRKREVTPPSASAPTVSEIHTLRLDQRGLDSSFFLIPSHRERFNGHDARRPADWSVAAVEDTDRVEEVFCATVPGSESFAIADFILTGNCRDKTGQPGVKSQHARKIALDINWTTNPYGRVLRTDMPRAMVDDILAIRTNNGKQVWTWGGDWSGNKDAMHYQIACSPADLATGIRGRAPGPTTDHPSDLQLALFFAKHFRLGVPDGPGVWNENSEGGADAVRFAQHGVNDWFDRWARLTGQPNPDDIPVNGVWDQRTRDAIAFMQKIQDTVEPGHGHNELGTTGPAFWESTYPTR